MAKAVDYRSLTGTEKAAIFVLSVGEDYAQKLFQYLEEEEIREISQSMTNLGQVNAEIVDRIFVEFVESLSSTGNLVGSYESTERLLSKVLGQEKVSQMLEDIRGPAGRTMWDKLSNVNEVVLANYLRNEYPQTVAVVLSKVKPEHSCRVLVALPDDFAADVMLRILNMEAVQREIIEDVEKTLRNEFVSNIARGTKRDGFEIIAEMLNNLDRTNENRFLGILDERDPESAGRVRGLMFTFEDLASLEGSAIQLLIRETDATTMAIALKGSNEEMKQIFFGNMSARAAKILGDDINSMGPVRMKAVDEAQQAIVTTAKNLAASGDIYIAQKGETDSLVY